MSNAVPTPADVIKPTKPPKPKQPELQLVPDAAQGDHPKVDAPNCGATRTYAGKTVECTRELLHPGNHARGGIYWRPRSGD
jgi:hypothetical protein